MQVGSQVALVMIPWIKMGWQWGVGGTLGWLFMMFFRISRDLSPTHAGIYRRGHTKRRTMLYDLIKDLQPSASQTANGPGDYQRRVLELVVDYVRDHCADANQRDIFANLLVERGDRIEVVARDTAHSDRHLGSSQPKAASFAWTAMQAKAPLSCPDICEFEPGASRKRPYRSVLAIPIVMPDGTVPAAVSIDSSRPYQFDGIERNLAQHLLPYIVLLHWTLQNQGGHAHDRSDI